MSRDYCDSMRDPRSVGGWKLKAVEKVNVVGL